MLREGLSLTDIQSFFDEQEDIRLCSAVIKEVAKQKEVERLSKKLDLSDAIFHAIIGTIADKNGVNLKNFNKWRNNIKAEINKILYPERKPKPAAFWKFIGKRKKI